MMSITIPH